MVFLRWILALATVGYALWNAVPPVTTLLFKLGNLPPAIAAESQRYVPLMQATPWWQVAVWLFADLVYLFAAFRLVSRPRGAFAPFLIAAVIDLANLLWMRQQPLYLNTFTAQELMLDYAVMGGLALGVVLYYAASRTRKKRVQPAVLTG